MMSDAAQGEGWWEASDGKWYPPDSRSDPRPPPPTGWSPSIRTDEAEAQNPQVGLTIPSGADHTGGKRSRRWLVPLALVLLLLAAGAIVWLVLGPGGDKKEADYLGALDKAHAQSLDHGQGGPERRLPGVRTSRQWPATTRLLGGPDRGPTSLSRVRLRIPCP